MAEKPATEHLNLKVKSQVFATLHRMEKRYFLKLKTQPNSRN